MRCGLSVVCWLDLPSIVPIACGSGMSSKHNPFGIVPDGSSISLGRVDPDRSLIGRSREFPSVLWWPHFRVEWG